MQVIILGDSGVGKTSLMNQYVRPSSMRAPFEQLRTAIELHPAHTYMTGQQEVQRKLQGNNRRRFPNQGGVGGR
jgi:GTPase SAR1 family protein